MSSKINYYNWKDISDIVENMSDDIKKNYKPDIIISVVRGGMIPSVILSHKLEVRSVENIRAVETINDEINAIKQVPVIEKDLNLNIIEGKKVLIVDDILGSGATIRKIKEEVKRWNPKDIKVAVCIVNEENWERSNKFDYKEEIDYIGRMVRGWVVFPWEV